MATPIGGLRVDLQLNSAAFIRDIAKTNAAIATSTRAMTGSLSKLQTSATRVGVAFGGWLTARAARRVISFLDQSIDLAAKLNNELGRTARSFAEQSEAMSNAFKLGVAKGFMDVLSSGATNATEQMERLARAGEVVGTVLGAIGLVVTDVFTILIPEAINLAIQGINKFIDGANKVLEWGQAFDNLFGLNKDYGLIPNLGALSVGLGDSAKIAADATNLAAESQKKFGDSLRKTTDDIIGQLNAMDELRQKHFLAALETTKNWLGVADTVGQALGTLFKDNKAVAIAQAVVNTAQAITEAMKLPFPINWAQVAAVTALGAAQIATIASTEPGGGSSMATKAPRGGSASAAAGNASRSSGASSQSQSVNIVIQGDSFGPEHFRRLVAGLNGVIADGATLNVSPA